MVHQCLPRPRPRLTFWYICRGNFIQLHLPEHKSSVILCQSKASVVSRGQSRYGHAHAAFSFQLSLRHMFNKLTHTRFLCTVLSGCVCVRLSWRDKVNFTVQTRVIKCNNSALGAPHRLQIVCLSASLSLSPSPSSSPSACV